MAKILLVEDDNNLREIYEARLQAEGYEIVSARDGEEALVVAKAEKPDLVISDIMMPKISGFEMLDILRNTEGLRDVKVIMLTALGQSDDQQRADKLGADRYLVKSQVTLEDIVKAAHDLLDDSPAPTPKPAPAPAPAPTPTPSPAPSVPPAPQTPPPPATPPPAAPPVKPEPPKPAASAEANPHKDSQDKLLDDAVNSLVADTDQKSDKTPKISTATSAVAAKAKQSDDDSASGSAPQKDDEEKSEEKDEDTEHTPVNHKKVIKPLEKKPGKDIQTLLAEEEAKETGEAQETVAKTEEAEPPKVEAANDQSVSAATTATEEAAIDAKIEDFVAGASTEPTPPTPPAAPPASTPAQPKPAAAQPPATTPPASTPAPAPTQTPQPPVSPPTSTPVTPSDPNIIAL
jgi:CheY-like chemotaxis protein